MALIFFESTNSFLCVVTWTAGCCAGQRFSRYNACTTNDRLYVSYSGNDGSSASTRTRPIQSCPFDARGTRFIHHKRADTNHSSRRCAHSTDCTVPRRREQSCRQSTVRRWTLCVELIFPVSETTDRTSDWVHPYILSGPFRCNFDLSRFWTVEFLRQDYTKCYLRLMERFEFSKPRSWKYIPVINVEGSSNCLTLRSRRQPRRLHYSQCPVCIMIACV